MNFYHFENIHTSEKVKPYVYICIHKTTKEFYIGFRMANKLTSNLDLPLYRTSSKKVKNRFEEFDYYILAEFFDPKAAYIFEQELIKEHWGSVLKLNRHYRTESQKAFLNIDEETKQKMRKAQLGRIHPESVKKKIRESRIGKPRSLEQAEKNRKNRLGIPHSEETKLKIGLGNKGKTVSEATKQKMKQPKSLEHRKNMSLCQIGKVGIIHSLETRQRISENSKGRSWWNNGINESFQYNQPEGFVFGRIKGKKNKPKLAL